MDKYVIALYIRLSMDDEISGSMSIENQRRILTEKAQSLPQYPQSEILEFVDNGYTGTNFERPAMQELLDIVRQGKINCIMVKDMSRFGRNMTESGFLIEKIFPLFHIRFIAVNDYYDSDNMKGDTGGINIAFKYLTSELTSKDTSIRTKSAKLAKMKRGEYQSRICIYGYYKGDDGIIHPDKEASLIVKQIFEWSVNGLSQKEICRRLYDNKILTPGEYKAKNGYKAYDISRCHCSWVPRTIKRVLTDERYIGTYVIRKSKVKGIGQRNCVPRPEDEWIKIPNHHEAIVSEELFYKVKKLSEAKQIKDYEKKRYDYPLRSKVFCGNCKHTLTRTKKKIFYCRSNYLEKDRSLRVSIKEGELAQVVFDTMKFQLKPLIHTKQDFDLDNQTNKLRTYEEQLKSIQNKKRVLYEKLISGEYDEAIFKAEKLHLEKEYIEVKNICSNLANKSQVSAEKNTAYKEQKAIVDEINSSNTLTKSMVDKLIDKIYVYSDKSIEIIYKTEDLFITK